MGGDFINQLRTIGKDFYTIADLEKLTNLNRSSLLVILNRLQKRKLIKRLYRGLYQLPDQPENIESTATQIYQPSYISFESALARYGIINQIPYTVSCATTRRPKKIILAGRTIEYRQIKPSLLTDFSLVDQTYLASKEKTLLDQLYMVSKGQARLDFNELNLKGLNKIKFKQLNKLYPRTTQKLAEKLVNQFGTSSVTIK